MPTPFPGFPTPAAGPDAPLQMLGDCHARITRQCDTLKRLVAHVRDHGSDGQAITAAGNVMRYFDVAALLHHADEEENLFPELRMAMAASDAVCIREIIQTLENQHRDLENNWQRLRPDMALIAQGQPASLDGALVEAFISLYREHTRREDDELFPMAARLLDEQALARIGKAMADRRARPENNDDSSHNH